MIYHSRPRFFSGQIQVPLNFHPHLTEIYIQLKLVAVNQMQLMLAKEWSTSSTLDPIIMEGGVN